MIGLVRLFLLGLLLLPTVFHSASAELVDLTWTGTTLLGSDGIGLFGPAGTVAAGTPYVARYRFDTSVGFSENGMNGSQQVEGGTFFNPATPIPLVSAETTINGVTVAANGDYDSLYFRQTGQGASQITNLAQREPSAPVVGELFQRVFRAGDFYTLPLDQPGEFDFDASDNPGGEFLQSNRDGQGNIVSQTQIGLIPSHLSITLAVPEPASLAYAVCGAIGAVQMLRRRRRR
jgi:hypothetical protein